MRFKCFAGCTREEILDALGLSLADIGPSRDAHAIPPRNTATLHHRLAMRFGERLRHFEI